MSTDKNTDINGKEIKIGDLLMMVNDKEYKETDASYIPTGSLGVVVAFGCYQAVFETNNSKIASSHVFYNNDVDVEILERHKLEYWNLDCNGNDLE